MISSTPTTTNRTIDRPTRTQSECRVEIYWFIQISIWYKMLFTQDVLLEIARDDEGCVDVLRVRVITVFHNWKTTYLCMLNCWKSGMWEIRIEME